MSADVEMVIFSYASNINKAARTSSSQGAILIVGLQGTPIYKVYFLTSLNCKN